MQIISCSCANNESRAEEFDYTKQSCAQKRTILCFVLLARCNAWWDNNSQSTGFISDCASWPVCVRMCVIVILLKLVKTNVIELLVWVETIVVDLSGYGCIAVNVRWRFVADISLWIPRFRKDVPSIIDSMLLHFRQWRWRLKDIPKVFLTLHTSHIFYVLFETSSTAGKRRGLYCIWWEDLSYEHVKGMEGVIRLQWSLRLLICLELPLFSSFNLSPIPSSCLLPPN